MLSDSRPIHSSRACRAIYLLSILLVFFNILFDVLDLDGSNFLRLVAPVKRTVTVAVIPSDTQINYSSEQSEFCGDNSLPFVDRSAKCSRPPLATILRSSPLGTARSHGYRVGLARNSLPDSPPYW